MPQSAIQRGAPGTYVYVINADKSVSVRKVTLGPGTPTTSSITQGLKAGEQVVIDGADKLKDGAKVLLRQRSAPTAAPSTPSSAARHQRSAQRQQANPGSQRAQLSRPPR